MLFVLTDIHQLPDKRWTWKEVIMSGKTAFLHSRMESIEKSEGTTTDHIRDFIQENSDRHGHITLQTSLQHRQYDLLLKRSIRITTFKIYEDVCLAWNK